MVNISIPSYLSRKSLLFLCLSVASAVFLFSPQSTSATTTIPIVIDDMTATTSLWTVTGLPDNTSCTYSFGFGTVAGTVTTQSGGSGSCNTDDWLDGDNSIRIDPNFDSPLIEDQYYTGKIVTASTTYGISPFVWDGTGFTVDFIYSSTTLTEYYSGFNSTYDTRFTDITFTDLEPAVPPTPVHSHIQIDVDYWLEESEINVNVSEKNPTQVKFSYALQPSTDTNSEFTTISATSYGSGSTTVEFEDLDDGTYDLLVQFSNIGASLGLSPIPFAEAYIYTSFTISGSRLTATGTPEYYDNTEPDVGVYLDCTLTQIDNCLKNVGLFLFMPSEESLDNFYTLRESISTKFPFNYVSDFKDAFTGFFTTATTQSLSIQVPFGSFGTITLLSADLINDVPFTSTIRLVLGYLLWVMLVLQIYRRTLKIFNSNETAT